MTIQHIAAYALPTAGDLPDDRAPWSIAMDKTVLLIHDMQDYFIDFYGAGNATIEQCVETTRRLRERCKKLGVPIVYTSQPARQSARDRGLLADIWGPGLTHQPEKAGIVARLRPDPDDLVLAKYRYSAFFQSSLVETMAHLGRNQLLICGIYGHIGVLQTAVHAFMHGIKPFLVADAIADFSREDHLMALRYVARNAGRTILSETLLRPNALFSKDGLRARLAAYLDEEPGDDDNLIDYGLDSIAVMQLIAEWKSVGIDVSFAELALHPTIGGWWNLLDAAQGTANDIHEPRLNRGSEGI